LIYTNGIGGPPQQMGTAEKTGTVVTSRAARAESRSLSMDNAAINVGEADGAKLSATTSVIAQAFSGSDVRLAKVAAMQQSIAAGTYSVSSSDITDKLIAALLQ